MDMNSNVPAHLYSLYTCQLHTHPNEQYIIVNYIRAPSKNEQVRGYIRDIHS